MTNEESIEKIKGILEECTEDESSVCYVTSYDADALDMAIKALEQTTWIPCSERLSGDRREVLVTAYWHETYQVMMGSYFGDGIWWCVPFNNSGEHTQRLKPKAWMPLPKPYKADNKTEQGLAYADQETMAPAT